MSWRCTDSFTLPMPLRWELLPRKSLCLSAAEQNERVGTDFRFLFVLPPQGVTGGIVRGAGKQKIGAVCNLVGFYFIGFPIGVSLMFPVKMGIVGEDRWNIYTVSDNLTVFPLKLVNCPLSISVAGLWSGFLICVAIQSTFFVVFLCKLNWKKATEEVSNSNSDIWNINVGLCFSVSFKYEKTWFNCCFKYLWIGAGKSGSQHYREREDLWERKQRSTQVTRLFHLQLHVIIFFLHN